MLAVPATLTASQRQEVYTSPPPGLAPWLGKDFCGEPVWIDFYKGLSEVVARYNSREVVAALMGAIALLRPVVESPFVAFSCGTAVAATLSVASLAAETLSLQVLTARLRQLAAIFASFDYQMKGEDYINESPWPFDWMASMENILRSMAFLKNHETQAEPWKGRSMREIVQQLETIKGPAKSRKVVIVSVCDYDPGVTPLARLSQINKEAYAKMHGYEVIIYDKAPVYEDALTVLMTEPHRPPAWSKVDGILTALADGQHDWIMWMDCDSFFMDPDVRLESIIEAAEHQCQEGIDARIDDRSELRGLVEQWLSQPSVPQEELIDWYDDLLERDLMEREKKRGPNGFCGGQAPPVRPPSNRSIGWSDWLWSDGRPQLIASEDGLMLNTGIVLIRASPWSWQFFQKVRWMTFGRSPVTQHPWWEQTAMVYLLQLPFTLAQASNSKDGRPPQDISPVGQHRGYAPAMVLMAQKQLNGYPPLVAAALKTHDSWEPGDYIVSFSGCKVYSSQEVCNLLFLNYFFEVHRLADYENDLAIKEWL